MLLQESAYRLQQVLVGTQGMSLVAEVEVVPAVVLDLEAEGDAEEAAVAVPGWGAEQDLDRLVLDLP